MKGKTVLTPTTKEMQELITSGKAELLINQTGNLLTLSGIEIVGPLPGKLYPPIVFTAALMNGAKDRKTAKELISFLHKPESVKVIKAKGMQPAK